jgi:membrane protein DedA with SNARE-associated domain
VGGEQVLQNNLVNLIRHFGDLGVFLAMFLESSIVPIPSEVIVAGAAAIGIPIMSILIFGSLGSTLGAMVGYAIGRYAALPVIVKFGKYVCIKPHHIQKAEAFARKYGVWGVLVGRVVPVVPFKVFSIASGLTNIPFFPFVACTLIGVIPRMYILAVLGFAIRKYQGPILLVIIGVCLIAYLVYRLVKNAAQTK